MDQTIKPRVWPVARAGTGQSRGTGLEKANAAKLSVRPGENAFLVAPLLAAMEFICASWQTGMGGRPFRG